MLAPLWGTFCMRVLISGLVSAGLLLSAPVQAAPKVSSPSAGREAPQVNDLQRKTIARIDKLVKNEMADCAAGRVELAGYARLPEFDLIDTGARRGAYLSIIICAQDYTDSDSLSAAEKLEPLAGTPYEEGALNLPLLLRDLTSDRDLKAAQRMILVLEGAPDLVDHWEPNWFTPMLMAARKAEPSTHLGLLSRLLTVAWTNPFAEKAAASWWRMDLARQQAKMGNLIAVRDTLRPVTNPESLVMIAQDRRFEKLWPEMQAAGRFDWQAVAEADLVRKQKVLADKPRQLTAVMDVIEAFRILGRAPEAVSVGESARARLATADSFDDQVENGPWMLRSLATALDDLGRHDEVDKVFAEAIAAGDKSGDRISQRINWAMYLQIRGRTQEVLQLMDAIGDDDGSDYGMAFRESRRVCALADTARDKAEALLPKIKARAEANPNAALQAYLCLNRLDEAAAVQISRLQSDEYRHDGLRAVMRGALYPRPFTPFEQTALDRRKAMNARPDVAKAIEAAGRPIQTPYAGDYWSPPL